MPHLRHLAPQFTPAADPATASNARMKGFSHTAPAADSLAAFEHLSLPNLQHHCTVVPAGDAAAWQDITSPEQLVRASYLVKAAWGDAGLFRLLQGLSGGPDPSLSENIEAPAALQVRQGSII